MIRTAIALLLMLSLMHADAFALAQETDNSIRMGIFPRRGTELTNQMFTPLAQGLSETLGRPVKLETAHDFATFWQHVVEQRYDIVHYNQYHYVRSHKDHGYEVIAQNVEYGQSKIAGAILVRKDSGINDLSALKGKKIAFGGGRRAMQAYIMATYLLRQAGLKEGDCFEQFALHPSKACIATYYHQTAAAGAGDYVLNLPVIQNEIDVDEMKYLAISEKLAHLPWAIRMGLNSELAMEIQQYMTELKNTEQGQAILKSAELTDLIRAEDHDYDPHRHIIKIVLNEDL